MLYRLIYLALIQSFITDASREVLARDDKTDTIQVISPRNGELSLRCGLGSRLSYCWFQHPNGTAFVPEETNSENALHRSPGNMLTIGKCGIIFKSANESDAGLWKCHMAEVGYGVEKVQTINVRITGPIAAEQQQMTASIGDEVSLTCVVSGGIQSLEYCRFLLPNGTGIHINDESNRKNAINGKYFLKEGARLSQGDCALTIISVEEEDFGQWLCAAKINEISGESHDKILVQNASSNTSVASSIGIVIGVIAVILIVAVGGFVMWQRRRSRLPSSQGRARTGARAEESIEIGTVEEPRLSGSSAGSGEQIVLTRTEPRPQQESSVTSI